MDYATGLRATRALLDGTEACREVLAGAPDFDPAGLGAFLRAQNLWDWFLPLAGDPRARALLGPALARDLDALREERPRRTRALVGATADLLASLRRLGIPCLLLKGLHLADRLYGDLDRRQQYDVDLLVRPPDFLRSLDALATAGFAGTSPRSARRLRRLRGGATAWLHPVPQTLTVRRFDGVEVDLHARLKGRQLRGLDDEACWRDRRPGSAAGLAYETLSDEHTLLFLVVSVAADLRRGRARAKHFLDLDLAAARLPIDWDAFLREREREGLLGVVATTLAVWLLAWERTGTRPDLATLLARRRRRIGLERPSEALALLTRRRDHPANRAWFRRLGGGTWLGDHGAQWTRDLPWTVGRLVGRLRGRRSTRLWDEPPREGVALPEPLRALLDRERLAPVGAEELTTRPDERARRRAFRIRLSDGRVVKGRVVRDESVAEAMARWLPRLPAPHFPPLLAAAGRATLEAWVEGAPLAETVPARARDAGDVLGRLHGVLGGEEVPAEDPRLARWSEDVERWTAELLGAGSIDGGLAERTLARARALRPRSATWGLQHGDFCAENLVAGPGGLACVDNTTVQPGVLESDVAQTLYRWPLRPGARRALLAGHARRAPAHRFLRDATYWAIGAALRAAAYRLREGMAGLDVPLGHLRRHVV